ncbi:histidinol-phosphate transaminase [Hahella sp. CCB-MM4]|uniref:histidinol-phosphate transaminase n=1 Tax=Hahella sp. (strain CCB-MM4) TaxID=1926491 RepID=UPI001FEF022D|nr:histidinol-phosphate transaminase [Hahella sp. CCB-MM4]
MNFLSLANAGIQKLTPYQPGKPIEELQRELGLTEIIKLASNENPLGPSPRVGEALAACVPELSRYPDGNAFRLKQALAKKLSVGTDQLTIGNGSNDILEFVPRVFANSESEIIFSEYSFAVYPLATMGVGAKPVVTPAKDWGHDLDAMVEAITEHTRVIFVANPNNPTGTWIPKADLEAFLARVPERIIVVLDEAYAEYLQEPDYPNGVSYISQYPNLIVTRTFSKAYGLAGLRLGYSISSPELADLLNRIRQPFNVNLPAQEAALAVLQDEEYLEKSIAVNTAGLRQLGSGFERLGLQYIPSVANFIAVEVGDNAGEIYQALLHKGVIVRPVANYSMTRHLRVSVGLESENERFLKALEEVLA